MDDTNDVLQVRVGTLVAELVRAVMESKLDTQASLASLDLAKQMVKGMEQPGAPQLGAIQFVSGSTAESRTLAEFRSLEPDSSDLRTNADAVSQLMH